jgi:hypothetical protein
MSGASNRGVNYMNQKKYDKNKERLILVLSKSLFGCTCEPAKRDTWKVIEQSPKILEGLRMSAKK